jgi:hypothetical protein
MNPEIDPTQNKDQHCKVYVEKDLKEWIKRYQYKKGFSSFSEAARSLFLLGISCEERSAEEGNATNRSSGHVSAPAVGG